MRGRGMAAAWLPLLGLRLCRGGVLRPQCSRLLARYFQVSAAKKAKAAGDETGKASPLSPEQLERIRKNKEAARQRLAERNVPPGFGESWRRQLAGEFSKPYFVEVSVAGPPRAAGLCGRWPGLSLSLSSSADGVCRGREETLHGLSAARPSLHLDADVRHRGCEWGAGERPASLQQPLRLKRWKRGVGGTRGAPSVGLGGSQGGVGGTDAFIWRLVS